MEKTYRPALILIEPNYDLVEGLLRSVHEQYPKLSLDFALSYEEGLKKIAQAAGEIDATYAGPIVVTSLCYPSWQQDPKLLRYKLKGGAYLVQQVQSNFPGITKIAFLASFSGTAEAAMREIGQDPNSVSYYTKGHGKRMLVGIVDDLMPGATRIDAACALPLSVLAS